MQIQFPPMADGESFPIETNDPIVLVGANGAGKTRMSVWIERHNADISVHRISAQKSLAMPEHVQAGDLEASREMLYYGRTYIDKEYLRKNMKWDGTGRWGKKAATHELNDYEHLLRLLVTDEADKSIEYRKKHLGGNPDFSNITIFDQLKETWSQVIPGKNLHIVSGKVLVTSKDGITYNGAEMSDGEREAFYFIAEALCVPSGSLIIVDEPENHMHEAILPRLWDAIEHVRADCVFMYVTHKLDFAISRSGAKIIWAKEMLSLSSWDYCLLPEDDASVPEELLLEIMGSRKGVVLVEGDGKRSWDRPLYQQLLPDKNIVSVGGCDQVTESVKAFNRLEFLADHVSVLGIVDRDYRDDDAILALKSQGVITLEVAEVENAFLLPCVINAMCRQLGRGDCAEEIMGLVQEGVFKCLSEELEQQVLAYVRCRMRNELERIAGTKVSDIAELECCVNEGVAAIEFSSLAKSFRERVARILESRDYQGALQVFNHKGLYAVSGLKEKLGLDRNGYMQLVVHVLSDRSTPEREKESEALAEQLRTDLGLDVLNDTVSNL